MMLFTWSKSLVVALLNAVMYSAAVCLPGQTTQIWNGIPAHDIHAHILAPSNSIRCSGAHLASSILAALTAGTVRNVNIMFSSLDAGLVEVGYEFLPPPGTAWKICRRKTLWNDYGQDLGQALLNHVASGITTSVPVPADFQPVGWNYYNFAVGVIPQIQAMCEEAMNIVQCLPLPPGPPRPAPAQVVVNNGLGGLMCMALVLNASPPPVTVFGRTCFPVQVNGPGPGPPGRVLRNPLEPLDPMIFTPGDPC